MAILRTPEGFQVDELLTEEFRARIRPARGPLALYRLTKRNLTTMEAIARVEQRLEVEHEAVGTAGLKDKHAQTRQHLTVRAGRRGCALPERTSGENWRIERIGWVDEPITGQAIAANCFRIELVSLTLEESRRLQQAGDRLAVGARTLRFVNYFGGQRFGKVGAQGLWPARRLIEGDFEGALRLILATPRPKDSPLDRQFKRTLGQHWGKWHAALAALRRLPRRADIRVIEVLARSAHGPTADFRRAFASLPYFTQQINVEAYQSHLWNALARDLISRCCPADQIWTDDAAVPMRFVRALAAPPALVDLLLPLPSPRAKPAPPWDKSAEVVLRRERLQLTDLVIPGLSRPFFGEGLRPLLVEATNFRLDAPTPASGPKAVGTLRSRVTFDLPRGAYATVLLAALGQTKERIP